MGGCTARERDLTCAVISRVFPADDDDDDLSESDEQKNLESYYLFWLDTTVRSPEFIESHNDLRSIINHTKIFESNKECQTEFEKTTNGKIFLIVNCAQGSSLLPTVYDHKQLHSIYIYRNGDNMNMDQIANQYKKIRGIYDSFITAKRYLEDDVKIHSDLDDAIVIDLLDNEYQEKFALFLKIVHVSSENIYDNQTRKRLIKMCTEYYDGNQKEVTFINEFASLYKPLEAISWYTRESCLHRLLSHAFIEHDMNILVVMYSFIVDINRNLQKKSIKESLRVYRGQFLSNTQLSSLKDNIGKMITMQCFLSAQTSREETLNLLQSIEASDLTFSRILVEIDALQDYTFVDNTQSSTSKTVLFMLGSVFNIVDVTETTITLSQCVSSLNSIYDLANESPLIIQGILTYLKDGTSEAIRYFKAIANDQSKTGVALRSSVYGQLGYLQQKKGDLAAATKSYEQSMHHGTMQFNVYTFYLDQAAHYHSTVLGDWDKAKVLWTQKLNIQQAFLSEEGKTQTYENLTRAALETKQYADAVEYTLAAIKSLPHDHPHLASLQQQLENAKKNLSENTTTE